jgi:hypothetical protein
MGAGRPRTGSSSSQLRVSSAGSAGSSGGNLGRRQGTRAHRRPAQMACRWAPPNQAGFPHAIVAFGSPGVSPNRRGPARRCRNRRAAQQPSASRKCRVARARAAFDDTLELPAGGKRRWGVAGRVRWCSQGTSSRSTVRGRLVSVVLFGFWLGLGFVLRPVVLRPDQLHWGPTACGGTTTRISVTRTSPRAHRPRLQLKQTFGRCESRRTSARPGSGRRAQVWSMN